MYSISPSDPSASTSNSSQTVPNKETINTPDSNSVPLTYYMIVGQNKNDEEKKKKRQVFSTQKLFLILI
jgi:hypothetical protein